MRALKINFDGPNDVSIDWNASVDGATGVAQRAGVSVMTQVGSDSFLPSRGTQVSRVLFSYGVFDLLGMQHLLNFGSLKAVEDMRDFDATDRADADRIETLRMSLVDVRDNSAHVGIQAGNAEGVITQQITTIE